MMTYSSRNFASDPGSIPTTLGASSVSRFTAALVRSVPTSGNLGSGWFSPASFNILSIVWPLPARNLSPPCRVIVIATFRPACWCEDHSSDDWWPTGTVCGIRFIVRRSGMSVALEHSCRRGRSGGVVGMCDDMLYRYSYCGLVSLWRLRFSQDAGTRGVGGGG